MTDLAVIGCFFPLWDTFSLLCLFLFPSQPQTTLSGSHMAHGESAPLYRASLQRRTYSSWSHTLNCPSLTHTHTHTWPDPTIVGADPFLQKPHTNLSSSRESESERMSKGVRETGGGRGGRPRPSSNSPKPREVGVGWDDDGGMEMEGGVWRRLRDRAARNIFTSSSDFYEF